MEKLHLLFSFFLLTLLFSSCVTDEPVEDFTVEGLRPVYITAEVADSVMSLPPQPITQLGKIYYKDNLIYVTMPIPKTLYAWASSKFQAIKT